MQLLTTVDYMREKGVEAVINDGSITDYENYDIIHLFNLTRISETYMSFVKAKKSHRPIVITPIYWDLAKFYDSTGSVSRQMLWAKYKEFRNEILNGCSMVYPASVNEMMLIKSEYGNVPCNVVYNCLSDKIPIDKKPSKDKKPYILCVGRICPRKNQLTLAKVCNELGKKLVLIGDASNHDYLNKCLEYSNVEHKSYMAPNKLYKYYSQASLHVLCSFVETPGLSSLEAAACGCNIVSTSEGCAKEYFEKMANYCDPYNEKSIKEAIISGLSQDFQPKLQKHILKHFNRNACLKTLYDSYKKLV